MSRLEIDDSPGGGGTSSGGTSSGTGASSNAGESGDGAGATSAGGMTEPGPGGEGGTSTNGGVAGSTGGNVNMAGVGGASPGIAGDGAGGEAGSGPVGPPICKPVTALNGSGLTLKATDISAFKYATGPAASIVKMAHDPTTGDIVLLAQTGAMHSVVSDVALPSTASTTPVTTTKPYASGYSVNSGYTDHRGIAFDADGSLYVLSIQFGNNSGVNIKKGVPTGVAGTRTWSTIVTTSAGFQPSNSNFDHSFSGITVSPDGNSLYFSSGSRTDHGELRNGSREVPLTSAIFKVPTTGVTDLPNDAAALAPFLFADGLHNTFDMAFNAAGDLIGAENGPDMDLPDELNFLQQGKHYGFPWRFGAVDNPVLDSAYVPSGDKRLNAGYTAVAENSYVYDAAFPAKPQGTTFVDPIVNFGPDANYQRVDRNAAPAQAGGQGLAGITGHRAPLGLAFDTAGALCGDYYEQGFLLSYGALPTNPLTDKGEDLLLVRLTKAAGKYTMTAKVLATGMGSGMDSVLVGNRLFTIGYGGARTLYVFALPTP